MSTVYPVRPGKLTFPEDYDPDTTAREHLKKWQDEEKDYWVMPKTAHGIVCVSGEALSELFFQGRSVVSMQYEASRDLYNFIIEVPELEPQEGVQLPTVDTIFTSTLDQYEVHLVKKNTTEE